MLRSLSALSEEAIGSKVRGPAMILGLECSFSSRKSGLSSLLFASALKPFYFGDWEVNVPAQDGFICRGIAL